MNGSWKTIKMTKGELVMIHSSDQAVSASFAASLIYGLLTSAKSLTNSGIMLNVRVSTSALVGDLDPYPQVYRLSKLKLRSV
jgi:hypothetical protein